VGVSQRAADKMGVDEARTKYALKWEALRERVQASRTYDLLARCLEIHFTILINNNNNNRKTFLMCRAICVT
jgi:hypothetical protein